MVIPVNGWTYSVVAFVLGLWLIVTGESVGSFIPMPSGKQILGFLLWLSIPFVWIGVLIR